jgi:hypothetical protein
MPQYCDRAVDNWNVDILFHAMDRVKEAKEKLATTIANPRVTKKRLEDLVLFERLVADRALWLRDRALTHALEYLSETTA